MERCWGFHLLLGRRRIEGSSWCCRLGAGKTRNGARDEVLINVLPGDVAASDARGSCHCNRYREIIGYRLTGLARHPLPSLPRIEAVVSIVDHLWLEPRLGT